MQSIFHAQQFLALAFEHLADRNAGPACDHFGDFLRRHALLQQRESFCFGFLRGVELFFQLWNFPILDFRDFRQIAVPLRRFDFGARLFDLLLDPGRALDGGLLGFPDFVQIRKLAVEFGDVGFQIGQALLGFLVLLLLQRLALDLELDEAALQAIEFFRLGIDFHADARCGFVHQIDGLVRQLPIGDITIRQRRRRHNGRIGDLHTVMHGIAFFEAAQDRDRVFHARLADEHFLETTFQRRILLDVFAIFVERGRADAVQLAARERRFQHVARIHRAFGLAGADHRVQLVDEEDDVAFFFREILQHRLETLLEFAAEFRTGDQRAHVERQHALAAQALRHFVIDNTLRQTLDDRRLANARLADQHRIVLGATLQHLDHAADFLVPADHRIELGFFRPRGQVDGVFFQRLTLFFRALAFHFFAAAHTLDRLFDVGLGRARGPECLAEVALVVERGEHEQLARDEAIAALLRQFIGYVEQPIQFVGYVDVAFLPFHRRQFVQRLAKPRTQRGDVDAGLGQQWSRRTALAVEQCRHYVHRLKHVVIAHHRKRLRIRQCLLETRG